VGVGATRPEFVLFCASARIAGFTGAVHGLLASSLFPNVVFAVELSISALAVRSRRSWSRSCSSPAGRIFPCGCRGS
jgi:hypothetical protein